MTIQLHPRTLIVNKAKRELAETMLKLQHDHDLTLNEMIGLLLTEAQESHRFVMRFERHKCYDKKADER